MTIPAEEAEYRARVAELRAARLGYGIRQADLAAKVGLTNSHLSKIETGYTRASDRMLERIAEAIEVKPW